MAEHSGPFNADDYQSLPPEPPLLPSPQPGQWLGDPSPVAPPRQVADWLRLAGTGTWMLLFMLLLGVAQQGWMIATSTYQPSWLIGTAQAVVYLVGVWLLTTAEPENMRWQQLPRWMWRFGVCVGLVLQVVNIIKSPADAMTSQPWYLTLSAAGAVGTLLGLWYLKCLAHRLGDSVLRTNFTVAFWIFASLLGIGIILVLAWVSYDLDQSSSGSVASTQPESVSAGAWACVMVPGLALVGWTGWMLWRLGRNLKRAESNYRRISGHDSR